MDALEHELGGLLQRGLPTAMLGLEGWVVELLVFSPTDHDTDGLDGAALLVVVIGRKARGLEDFVHRLAASAAEERPVLDRAACRYGLPAVQAIDGRGRRCRKVACQVRHR